MSRVAGWRRVQSWGRRSWSRRIVRALGGVLALVLVVTAAWVASNVVDSAPAQVPSALRLVPAAVADDRNAFFVLAGMAAPAGQDPLAWGRDQWTAAETDAPSARPPVQQPFDGMLDCIDAGVGCAALLAADPARFEDESRRHEELGRRCLRVAHDMPFEELLPAPEGMQPMVLRNALHAQGAAACGRWWAGMALAASARRDKAGVANALDHAARFGNALLAGSRSLIGHAVAWAAARRTWRTAAAIAAADRSMLEPASRALMALPVEAMDATRWMAFEAAFARAAVDDARTACRQSSMAGGEEQGFADRLVCDTGIGLLPNLTKAHSDARWLRAVEAARDGLPEALTRPPFVMPDSTWPDLAWRNTLGRLLLDTSASMYAPYLARQADVALHHAALQLAFDMTRDHVDATGRAAWIEAHALAPELRGRVRVEGEMLVVDHLAASQGMNRPQDLIRIPLAGV